MTQYKHEVRLVARTERWRELFADDVALEVVREVRTGVSRWVVEVTVRGEVSGDDRIRRATDPTPMGGLPPGAIAPEPPVADEIVRSHAGLNAVSDGDDCKLLAVRTDLFPTG